MTRRNPRPESRLLSALAFALVSQAMGYVVVAALGLPAILRYRGRAEKDSSAEAAGSF